MVKYTLHLSHNGAFYKRDVAGCLPRIDELMSEVGTPEFGNTISYKVKVVEYNIETGDIFVGVIANNPDLDKYFLTEVSTWKPL